MNIVEKIKNIKYLFKPRSKYYSLLGFEVNDIAIYDLAFVLSSERNRRKLGAVANNERLEFLGDAILEAIITHMLYEKYTDKREGFLSSLRSLLIKRSTLNSLGKELHLENYLNVRLSGANVNVLGNAFEALVGAIYIDKGYQSAYEFVKRVFSEYVNEAKLQRKDKNYKSQLLEYCQHRGLTHSYELLSEERMPGNKMKFQVKVIVDDKQMGNGVGSNKREAEQAAAKQALHAFNSSNYKFKKEKV
ncbi:MAG: ribonuclease III [bacterium]